MKSISNPILDETQVIEYCEAIKSDPFGIKTKYEKMFSDKGEKIKYLKFRIKL